MLSIRAIVVILLLAISVTMATGHMTSEQVVQKRSARHYCGGMLTTMMGMVCWQTKKRSGNGEWIIFFFLNTPSPMNRWPGLRSALLQPDMSMDPKVWSIIQEDFSTNCSIGSMIQSDPMVKLDSRSWIPLDPSVIFGIGSWIPSDPWWNWLYQTYGLRKSWIQADPPRSPRLQLRYFWIKYQANHMTMHVGLIFQWKNVVNLLKKSVKHMWVSFTKIN